MENQGNKKLFVPLGLGNVRFLPKNRAYTKMEASFSVSLDNFKKNKVSTNGYAKLWGWNRGRVRRFLDNAGVEIAYPRDTKSIQNQRGILRQKQTDKQTDNGQMIFIDINELQSRTNRKQTDKRPLLKKSKDKDNTLTPFQDKKDGVPHDQIVTLYHEILSELPQVRDWNEKRKAMLQARWREKKKRQTLDWWRGYFEYVGKSKFLMGENGDFQASLEWLVRPSNLLKVTEGNYHRKGR